MTTTPTTWRSTCIGGTLRSGSNGRCTFHDDDAFTPAFSYAAGTGGNFETAAYTALGKTPHTHGGYRLYSARATLAYSAPYIVTDEVAAAANPFDPLAVLNVHPVIDSESFTYLMDHPHDSGRKPAPGTFTGNSTPLVVHDGDTERNPDAVGAINEAGYAASSPYTEVLIDIDDIAIPVENTGQNLSAYAEEQVPVQADSGFTTVDGIPNLPVVLTSRTQGMPRVSQEELGNYFVVPLGPNAAGSQFARSDPNGVGNDDHVEFRNFYWNFADNRPMFLLFNNYGWSREASRQEGAWNAQPLPVPMAFSFNSQDARMVLIQQPGPTHIVTMQIPYDKLVRVDNAGTVSYFVDGAPLNLPAKMNCAWGRNRKAGAADMLENAAIAAGNEFDQLQKSPPMCLFGLPDGGGVYERQLRGGAGAKQLARPRLPREEPDQPAPVRADPEPRHAAGLHRAAEPRHAPPAARDARLCAPDDGRKL